MLLGFEHHNPSSAVSQILISAEHFRMPFGFESNAGSQLRKDFNILPP